MRFPDSKTGLGTLEQNVLMILKNFEIKSKKHLMGYALNYQGYYGYKDLQFERVFNNLNPFFEDTDSGLNLNDMGRKVLDGELNSLKIIDNSIRYGGIHRTDFFFDKSLNKLIKSNV